ncbi:MAG: bile acid:sodium symporter family protein [Porticoccaceae bacterium]
MIETIYKVIVPTGLMLMMFGMGLQLVVDDWLRVVRYPRAVVVGMVGQFIALPLIAVALVYFLPLPLAISAGLIILAVCPGGITSNSVSFLARGDLALSVTLTAISSLLALITIPLFLSFGLALVQDGAVDAVVLPIGSTVKQLLVLVFVPLVLGMVVRHYAPGFAVRSDPWVRAGGVALLLTLLVGAVALEYDFFIGNLKKLWPVLFALNIASMAAGYLLARLARLDGTQCRTICIEVGIQNVALGAMIAMTILKRPDWMVVSSVYSVVMSVTSFVFIGAVAYNRRRALAGSTAS